MDGQKNIKILYAPLMEGVGVRIVRNNGNHGRLSYLLVLETTFPYSFPTAVCNRLIIYVHVNTVCETSLHPAVSHNIQYQT